MTQFNGKINLRTTSKPLVKEPLITQLARRADIPMESPKFVDQSWDELETLYQASAQVLVQVAMGLNSAVRVLNESGTPIHPEVRISVQGLQRDLESRTNQLVTMHETHQGRTGPVQDGADNATAIEIGLGYVNFNEENQVLFFQPMATISEHINELQVKRKAEAAQAQADADLLDPKVVTDVATKTA